MIQIFQALFLRKASSHELADKFRLLQVETDKARTALVAADEAVMSARVRRRMGEGSTSDIEALTAKAAEAREELRALELGLDEVRRLLLDACSVELQSIKKALAAERNELDVQRAALAANVAKRVVELCDALQEFGVAGRAGYAPCAAFCQPGDILLTLPKALAALGNEPAVTNALSAHAGDIARLGDRFQDRAALHIQDRGAALDVRERALPQSGAQLAEQMLSAVR